MMVHTVRCATVEDVPALTRLEERVFGVDAWSDQVLRSSIDRSGDRGVSLVATPANSADDGATVIGYAVVSIGGEMADLDRIAVTTAARRSGVGRRLLTRVVEEVVERRCARLLLEVGSANLAALGFYEARGFRVIDRRRRYYRDGTDALVMALDLYRHDPKVLRSSWAIADQAHPGNTQKGRDGASESAGR